MLRFGFFFLGLVSFVFGAVQRVSVVPHEKEHTKEETISLLEGKNSMVVNPVEDEGNSSRKVSNVISTIVQKSVINLVTAQLPKVEAYSIQENFGKVIQQRRNYVPVIGILFSALILVVEVLLVIWLINGKIG